MVLERLQEGRKMGFLQRFPKRFANIKKTFQKSSHKRFTETFSQPN